MNTRRHHCLSQRHLGWLLWLVLLLPIAQTASTWHVLSHARSEQAGGDAQAALHQDHCELCFSAATLLGGAPLGTARLLPDIGPLGDAPHFNLHTRPLSTPARAYDSRAPPVPSL